MKIKVAFTSNCKINNYPIAHRLDDLSNCDSHLAITIRQFRKYQKKEGYADDISTFTGVQFPSPAPRIIQKYLAKINSIFRIVTAEKICFFG
jgi:hypothetical protein